MYGACTPVGRLVAKVMAVRFGYSVLLIDTTLHKLQELEVEIRNCGLKPEQTISVLNLHFARYPDSTTLETKLHALVL